MRKATLNKLSHFDVNMDMFQSTADYVVSIIKVRIEKSLELPLPIQLTECSETLRMTISQYRLMDAGSTSTSEAVREWIDYFSLGPAHSTPKKGHAV
jgi:hypothetical protein